jgi:hypothetical protein
MAQSRLRREFEREGYLVLPGFVPADACDTLRRAWPS